ncbi:MAG: hypothetical protein IJ141_08185 [Lachnospiraceae bacterium]|nr:hypothetical protein [Lachnospiraceae bacterium]
MNSLYKRLVSIGMISFTALLGWVYCIIEFRDKPVYVICVSVALIISVYVLLRSVISIRQRKDKKLKKDINEAVAKLVADFYEAQAQAEQPDNSLEVERICKALYVQLRKVNTTLSNDLITKEILNNATKVNIKYNHADSSKLLAAISDLSESLKLAPEPQVIIKEVPIAAPQPAQAAPVQAVVPEPVVAPEPEPVTSVEPEPVAPADDGGVLSQEALDELLSSMNTATEAAPEPEPVKEAAPVPADDGGVLSQEALDALLASMNTTTEAAPEPEPVKEAAPAPADDGGVLSQEALDALLASMNTTTEAASEPDADKTETTAIPENVGASSAEAQSFFDEFEAKHEHTSEQGNASSSVQADAPAPAPADDGGVLSQAELDALLASMGPAPEPVAEPEPEPVSNVLEFPTPAQEPAPVSDDPNKVLSPEEIAALFNSMK